VRIFFCLFYVLSGQANTYIIQMLDFLPENVKEALTHLNVKYVYEIRLRANAPTRINYRGEFLCLTAFGVSDRTEFGIICDAMDIADCIYRAGKYSVYSVEEQIKRGYITAANGERIGLAGEYVFESGQPLTIRNITSVCIRIPHEIIGCGQEIYACCLEDKLTNVLIASPPGLGKTTILRDLARLISEKTRKNVLICDERGEISCGRLGETSDVIKFADKQTAFEAGIRAMRPDVIITDELHTNDCQAIEKAYAAGVNVVASAHFNQIKRVKKDFFSLFDYVVILNQEKIGEIAAIYDKEGRRI